MTAKGHKESLPKVGARDVDNSPTLPRLRETALVRTSQALSAREVANPKARLVAVIVESFDRTGLLPLGGRYTWAPVDMRSQRAATPLAGCAVGAIQLDRGDDCLREILDELGGDQRCIEAGFDDHYTDVIKPACRSCGARGCLGYAAGAEACRTVEDKLFVGLLVADKAGE